MKTDFDFDLTSLEAPCDASYPPAEPLVRIWLSRMLVLFGKHQYAVDPQGGANFRLVTHTSARSDYLSPTEKTLHLLVAAAGVTMDVQLFLIIGALSRQQKGAERMARQITARLQ